MSVMEKEDNVGAVSERKLERQVVLIVSNAASVVMNPKRERLQQESGSVMIGPLPCLTMKRNQVCCLHSLDHVHVILWRYSGRIGMISGLF